MGNLSALVSREYDEEVEIIRTTGSLRTTGIVIGLGLALFWLIDFLTGRPWTERDFALATIFLLAAPPLCRAWERRRVAAEIQHHRACRMEVKIDALLGLVNIKGE